MTIIEISQRSIGKASQEFLEAGRQVFAGDPNWIPPLNIMLRDQLSPKSPYFRHADATFFTARKNGRIVGRISAQVDQQHLQLHQDECGFFGFFDTIDDQDVASALYKAAADWLRAKAMKRIRGPISLSTNQEVGTLIEGFDSPPMVMMPHSRTYQGKLIEGCGTKKIKGLYAWRWSSRPEMPRRCAKAHLDMKNLGVHFRTADLKEEMDQMVAIFDDAWGTTGVTSP